MNKNNKPEIRIQNFEDEWKLRSFSAFSKDTGRKNNDDLDFEPYAITKVLSGILSGPKPYHFQSN